MARYEDKFLVPLSSLSEVENVFDSDHVNFEKPYSSRFVGSIYYDTEDFDFAKQNSDGIGLRSKVRIRFYDNNIANSSLEVKTRHFSVGKKVVLPVRVKDQLHDGSSLYEKLSIYHELDLELLKRLSPKLLVRYKRKYWTSRLFHGVRITLDSSIVAKEIVSLDSLDSLFNYNVPFQNICVLEVKYDSQANIGFFSEYFQDHLKLRRSRSSKYVMGLLLTSQLTMI